MWEFCVKSLAWLCKNSEVWFMIKFKINLCRIIPEVFVFPSDGITVIPFAPFFLSLSLKQFPKNGELILRRLVLLFRRAYRRNAKVSLCARCWYLLKEDRTDSNSSHNNSLPIPSSSSLVFFLFLLPSSSSSSSCPSSFSSCSCSRSGSRSHSCFSPASLIFPSKWP